MSRNRSEIFDEFVKVAQEKGLISQGAEPEHTAKNTPNPRWDSLDIDAIQALYGVKPDLPKGMEYEHNIMEDAHPNAMVIAPSYDKLNGLVENENERQNIIMHIVMKEPEDGTLDQKRYPMKPRLLYPTANLKKAHKNLLLSLVRIGNDMDNKDHHELRALADTCLGQVSEQSFTKQAIIPLIIGGAAALLGAIWAHQHLPDVDEGLKENYARVQKEANDLLSDEVGWGVGHKYDEQLKDDVKGLLTRLSKFWSVYEKAQEVIREMEKPRDAQEMMGMLQQSSTQQVLQAYQALQTVVGQINPYLDKIVEDFGSSDYKHEHTVEKGALTSLIEKIPGLHGGEHSLTADDFDDVVNALATFRDSVQRLMGVLQHARTIEQKAAPELAETLSKTVPVAPQTEVETPVPAAEKSELEPAGEVDELEKSFQELAGG